MSNAAPYPRLTVPQLPPRYVSRPRLLAALDDAAAFPLTLLSAGPGTGKTVLLTDWVRRSRARVAWLTLAPADADPRRFWRLLESALQEDDDAEPGPAVPKAAQLVLVVDDAHLLTHATVLEDLDRLIRGSQPGLRLVLAARSDPLLPLHRYRLAGQIYELRASDLAMTPAEIAEVLAVHGISLPAQDFDRLVARTEGWAAGVQLSAMRMETAESPSDFVSELAMDTGSIGEYLVSEVLNEQPELQRMMLIQTSFLDEVTGPLADTVTGMTGCGDMLAGLARENSFVIPLDAAQERYRYHHLFAEMLRYLLRRNMRQGLRGLQERAAAWFEGSGDLGNALYWAVQAGNRHHVVKLLARGGFAHAFVHRQDLSGLGLKDLLPLRRPQGTGPLRAAEFDIASSALEAVFADADSAARELGRLRSLKPDQALTDPDLLVTSDLVELVLGQKAFDASAVDGAAHRLLGRGGDVPVPARPGLRSAVLLAQASSRLWHGRHEDVGVLLEEALTEARRDGMPGLELEALGMVAFVDSIWSRTNHADEAARQAHVLRRRAKLGMPPALDLAAALRSLIAGDLDGQAQALRRILLPDVVGADPGLAVALRLGQASMLLAGSQAHQARLALDLGRHVPPVLAVQRDVMLADLDTSLGRPRAALRLLRSYLGGDFAVLTAAPRARAYLALGDLRSARECIRGVLTAASPQAGRVVLVEALLCDARIAQLDHDPARALENLVRALEIARGEIILPFLQVRDVFAGLLARHPAVAVQWPVPAPRISPEAAVEPGPGAARYLPEPLTQREMTILRFLGTSMSTAEIADELRLSVNTVKTHLATIYRKLAVSRRREAVLRARELELI
jgi:LuxR family transcriptional regulator, maltose regulon positive regulatory protein